jgi:hypothetical protein
MEEQQYNEDSQSEDNNIVENIVVTCDEDNANGTIVPIPNAEKSSEDGKIGSHIDSIVGSIVGGKDIVDKSFEGGNEVGTTVIQNLTVIHQIILNEIMMYEINIIYSYKKQENYCLT